MKAVSADLLTSVTGAYDKTKTTKFGNVIVQTVNGNQVISPPLIKFIDTLSDFGVTPLHAYASPNGRVFITTTSPAGQTPTVVLYSFNYSTGAAVPLGGIKLGLVNTATHTIRQIKCYDSGTTGWKIFLSTINTTAANGGLYMGNQIALSDFVLVSFPTIATATTGDTQASKKVFHLVDVVGANTLTVAQGHAISSDRKVYVGNNVVATFQIYKFDADAAITTVSAGGETADCFLIKTGNIGTPAGLIGTILLLNSFDIGTPTEGPNIGNECIYIPGSTGFNEFRLSDVTNGATTLPTLRTANVLDAPSLFTTQTPTVANYSETLSKLVWQTGGRTIVKSFVNNLIDLYLGYNSPQYRSGLPSLIQEFGAITISSGELRNGWCFNTCTTASQQGVLAMDIRSDQLFDYSYFTSKVMTTLNAQWISVRVNNRLRGSANSLKLYYRGSNNPSDTLFDSASGGWVSVANDYDMSAISSFDYVQFKGAYYSNSNPTAIFAQPSELRLLYTSKNEISDNWEFNYDDSSTGSPSRVSFRLKETYSSSVPALYFRAYDLSNSLVANHNSSANPTFFEYSTDSGVNWLPLGTIPNTLGTLIRYNFSTPPGVEVRPSLRES